jgi:regulator of vacuolar morphogenesis
LKAELESLYSDQLPYKFPPKTYIRKSVNNNALAEERRFTLEKFLQDAVCDKVNIKWRRSLPFREFLNLPPGIFSSNENTQDRVNAAWSLSVKHDEPIVDTTTWIDTVRETKSMLQDARSKVFVEPNDARRNLIVSRARFDALTKGLELSSDDIGEYEAKRRTELLNSLKREHRDIEALLSNVSEEKSISNQPLSVAKKQLLKGRIIGEPQETGRTRALDNQELLQVQKQDFKDQDEELEQLSKVIQRQRELGIAINEELQLQNELLDELDGEVDRVSSKLHYAHKRVGKFT